MDNRFIHRLTYRRVGQLIQQPQELRLYALQPVQAPALPGYDLRELGPRSEPEPQLACRRVRHIQPGLVEYPLAQASTHDTSCQPLST